MKMPVPNVSSASLMSVTLSYCLVGTSVCVEPVLPVYATRPATALYAELVSTCVYI